MRRLLPFALGLAPLLLMGCLPSEEHGGSAAGTGSGSGTGFAGGAGGNAIAYVTTATPVLTWIGGNNTTQVKGAVGVG